MAKLSRKDVLDLAHLARITLAEDEISIFVGEINAILGYVEQLQTVDVKGLEPTYQVTGLKSVTRSDVVIDYGEDQKALLKNAPETKDGQIKVKRVL